MFSTRLVYDILLPRAMTALLHLAEAETGCSILEVLDIEDWKEVGCMIDTGWLALVLF